MERATNLAPKRSGLMRERRTVEREEIVDSMHGGSIPQLTSPFSHPSNRTPSRTSHVGKQSILPRAASHMRHPILPFRRPSTCVQPPPRLCPPPRLALSSSVLHPPPSPSYGFSSGCIEDRTRVDPFPIHGLNRFGFGSNFPFRGNHPIGHGGRARVRQRWTSACRHRRM